MATMGSYCKAYPVSAFAQYTGWSEKPATVQQPAVEAGEGEERYLFLQENFVVTAGVFLDEDVVFDQVTPEWKAFCTETLEFHPEAELAHVAEAGQ